MALCCSAAGIPHTTTAQLSVDCSSWTERLLVSSAKRNDIHTTSGASFNNSSADLEVAAAAAGNKPVQRPRIWTLCEDVDSSILGSFPA